jgi:DNA-binding NarL/FixJ family response regulator
VNTWRIVIFGVKSALLTSRDEECGFSQENGEQYRKDPFEEVAGSIVVFNVMLPGGKSDRQLLHSLRQSASRP